MNGRQHCTHEGRTARFNLPVCRRLKIRQLLGSLVAPPARLHRYRNLTVEMLEDTLDSLDNRRCN